MFKFRKAPGNILGIGVRLKLNVISSLWQNLFFTINVFEYTIYITFEHKIMSKWNIIEENDQIIQEFIGKILFFMPDKMKKNVIQSS